MYQDESTWETLSSYPYLSFLIDNIMPGRESYSPSLLIFLRGWVLSPSVHYPTPTIIASFIERRRVGHGVNHFFVFCHNAFRLSLSAVRQYYLYLIFLPFPSPAAMVHFSALAYFSERAL
jgi:hypothetical protein